MTVISFNKSLVHPGYEGIISQMYVSLANSFYDKFKEKDIEIIKRYNKILSPQNIFDVFVLRLDDGRVSKLAAVRRIIYENNKKNLEFKTN